MRLSLTVKLCVIVLGMFAFGYALVPIYKSICEMTGINVLALAEEKQKSASDTPTNTQVDKTRKVVIELDANGGSNSIWEFKPEKNFVEVHPGELTTVNYTLRNKLNRVVAGQAIPSYAPQLAVNFFNKLECFCFKQQLLEANEVKVFPVVFSIDPKLPKEVQTITLSYTFFEIPVSQIKNDVKDSAKP